MPYAKDVAAAALLVALSASSARADGALPANEPLIEGGVAALKVAGKSGSEAKVSPVDDATAPGKRAIRVEVRSRAANDYDIQLAVPTGGVALKKGDVVWASIYARAVSTGDESGQGVLGLVVEQKTAPYDKLIQRKASIGKTWQQLAVPARLSKDYAAGTTHLTLRLGGAAQVLELADPQFVRFTNPATVKLEALPQTRITYGGREPDAPWRKAADARIEQLRKAPLVVRVTDAAGKPVAGASVDVAMRRHAFPFGCVYNVNWVVGKNADTPDGKTYRDKFAELFNVGVDEYAMKWPGWEEPATRQLAMDALRWMDERGIRVRGHTMVWPGWSRLPADVKTLENDPARLGERIDAHIRDIGKALAGRVTEWDVVNEPYVNNDLMKILGEGAMAHWFTVAREADASAVLYLNETSVPTSAPKSPHYDVLYRQAEAIKKAGAPLGGIGMQAHFGSSLTGIAELQAIYDRFARLGVPLQITELDIDVSDETLQAEYLRDFMTITFAHPNSSGVMMWGFWRTSHWRPDAALFRADWSVKPVGQAWMDLVRKKWWTTASLKTATDGTARVRGFLGDYDLTVTHDGKTTTVPAKLARDGKPVTVVLK